ncbi:unnamed protein product [Malus baccata var. baccata]
MNCIYSLQHCEHQQNKRSDQRNNRPRRTEMLAPQLFHPLVPVSLVILVHIVAKSLVVKSVDHRVVVQLVEEPRSVFRAQPVHQYSHLAKKVDVLARIDEIIHQDGVRCYLVGAAVTALLEGDEVPEERPCRLVDS